MTGIKKIPLFPLGVLPIPKELIPLHIFEPKYKALLNDVKSDGGIFGILFDHPLNTDNFGSIVKIESTLKEYETGETDIVVQCISNFVLTRFYPRFKERPYPGGEIIHIHNHESPRAGLSLKKYFEKYLKHRNADETNKSWKLHDIANMLHLEVRDRINYIKASGVERKEHFLQRLIKYHFFLLEQEDKSRSKFYLN